MKKLCKYFSILLILIYSQQTSAQLKALDINLENYAYPFPVHFITLNIQDTSCKMAYMDVTPVHANGHVILLLHGKNFNGTYWRETAKALSGAGYRVIIPDQVGFGKSEKPQHIQYSFQLLAQNTKTILDTLNIKRIYLLGHSMGGMLATRFTLMYPQVVEKLVLEDPIGLEDWKLKVPYQPIEKQYQHELKQTYDSIKKYEMSNYYHDTWKPDYDEWLNLSAGWTLNSSYPKSAWNASLTSDMIFTQPVCYEFDSIKTRTLLIVGKLDRTAIGKNLVSDDIKKTMGNYPELGKRTHAKISNSTLIELDNTGHVPHIEAFEKFIKPVLDFLNE